MLQSIPFISAGTLSFATTSMHLAAKNGKVAILNLLVREGVNPNAFDFEGNTPMHIAIRRGNEDFAMALIEAWRKTKQ